MKKLTMNLIGLFAALPILGGSLTVGPDYKRPTNSVASQYKTESLGDWKAGQPLDHVPKGAWWEIFGDVTLNDLQRRATEANAWGRSGLNVWVPVADETAAVVALRDAGFAVAPGRAYSFHGHQGIRISTPRLDPKLADAVAEAVAQSSGPASPPI